MNALEKLKLSKELRSLLGGMDGLKAMEKLKAAKRVRELVALLGGGSGQSNNEMEYARSLLIRWTSCASLTFTAC